MKTTGVILAGGKSSRMGTDKSILIFHEKTFIDNNVNIFKEVVDEIIIVSNQHNKYGYKDIQEVSDIYQDMGPLAGIHAGILAAEHDTVFITACDMPLIETNIMNFMLKESKGFDVTVPKGVNGIEPLFAVYSKNVLPYIESYLIQNKRKIINFYQDVNVNYIDENEIKKFIDPKKVFFNVNTQDDYFKLNTSKKRFNNTNN